jgi:hypothetical protein
MTLKKLNSSFTRGWTDPYCRLAAAVLLHAYRCARAGEIDAQTWLESEEASLWFEVLQIDCRLSKRWRNSVPEAQQEAV